MIELNDLRTYEITFLGAHLPDDGDFGEELFSLLKRSRLPAAIQVIEKVDTPVAVSEDGS